MPLISPPRELLRSLALIAVIAICPLCEARGAGDTHADTPDDVDLPHSGATKDMTCAQKGRDRVRALMTGTVRAPVTHHPAARNRTCG